MIFFNHKLVIKLLSIGIILFQFAFSNPPLAKKVKTIVIDAGHGGKDPGCSGVNHREKDVTLAVALKLGKLITEKLKDVKVIYTRKTDVFVELEERAQIANRNNADLFISIHCNAAAYTEIKVVNGKQRRKDVINKRPYGSETYVMGIKNEAGKTSVMKRENAAILLEDNYKVTYNGFDPNSDESYILFSMFAETFVEQSVKFASEIQNEYKTRVGRIDKGVKRQSLWVLWRTKMPSVLTEIGYLTNPEEEKFLGSEKGQYHLAAGLFRAFRKYKADVEGSPTKFDDDVEKMEILVNENLVKGDSSYLKEIEDFKDESDTAQMTNNEKQRQLIKEAERFFEIGDYSQAEKKYNEVLVLNPGDKLSKERITSINNTKKKYQNLISQGDKLFNSGNYSQAKKNYEEAQAIMSKESYPTEKIKLCEEKIKEQQILAQSNSQIAELLKDGNVLLQQKQYFEAEKKFREILKIDSTNSVAKQKITDIRAFENKEKTTYSDLLKQGDELLSGNHLDDAKSKFYQASLIKPDDEYPKKKIAEIAELKDQLKNKNQNTNSNLNSVAKNDTADKNKVFFKVQFLQSPTEIKANDSKISKLEQVSFYKLNGVYKYTSGIFSDFETASVHKTKLVELGYKDAFLVAFLNSERIDLKRAKELLSQQKNQ